MKIYIATDHRGVDVEKELIEYLKTMNVEVESSHLEHYDTDDYPDFAFDVCKKVVSDNDSLGILLCGTGIGMSIAANKVKGIRAAHCSNIEQARLAKEHNNANIICISYKQPIEEIKNMIKTFIETLPSTEERHVRRVNKIVDYERGNYNEL